jgi:protein involved in polysaccharide export with SLBB domain
MIMNSRACLIRLFFSICLGASCVFGLGAGTNDPPSSAPLRDQNSVKLDSSHKLSPSDVISVTVFGEDDLTVKSTIVDENGMIMLPLLGQVKISGLSIVEATDLIRQKYDKDLLVKPQVNLIVDKFAERRFAVLGQVQRPGAYEFPQNAQVNLLEAIAMAGGYTRLGDASKVNVLRVVNGTNNVIKLDAGAMSKDPKLKRF